MSDFSWPVFYRLSIKNEDQLPRYVIPGRRIKIKLNMVNELDMFRGDDILAECPIPLRVAAIPVQENGEIDATGKMLNRHEIFCEVLSKSVGVKPVIERGGQGAVIIDLSPSPVLRVDEELLFVIQIGISSSSRIFNHVIPVTTQPLIMVSPHSEYAKQYHKRTDPNAEEDDEHYDDYEEEDEDDEHEHHDHSKCGGHHHGDEHKHNHHHHDHAKCGGHHDGPDLTPITNKKAIDVPEHEDEDNLYEDEDGLFDGMEGEDGLFDGMEGDDELYDDEDWLDEDEEEDEIANPDDGPFANDLDLYEPVNEVEEDEEMETNLAELPGIFHAFVCDPLLQTPLHPNLIADSASAPAPPASNAYANAPTTVGGRPQAPVTTQLQRGGPNLQVSGGVQRRPKALPPALQKRDQAAVAAHQQQKETEAANVAKDAATKDTYPYPFVGNKTQGIAQTLFEKPLHQLLDPLNGIFATNTNQTSSTIQQRHTIAMASYAYIKVVQGISIGGRIWDGAIYLMKFFVRLLQQTHTPLDGSRCLELGSGTGVLGIWWWQLIQQRTLSQLNQLCSKYKVKRAQVEGVLHLICNGDFAKCAAAFAKPGEELNTTQNTFSITIDQPILDVAMKMKTYITSRPTMIVTDQPKIMPLLDQNVRMNSTGKQPGYNQRVIESALKYTPNPKNNTTTISVANPLAPQTQAALHHTTVTGLHALTCDWNDPLNKPLLKTCGVYLPTTTKNLFDVNSQFYTNYETTLNTNESYKKALVECTPRVDLPEKVTIEDVELTTTFNNILKLNANTYDGLRQDALKQYELYESLQENIDTTNTATSGLEELLISASSKPGAPTKIVGYNALQGLDMLLAVECLYNDRYFEALQKTIISFYHAHMFAFAQKVFLYSQVPAGSSDAKAPQLQLPLVLLSYRLRAVHEEELIQKTFFAPLEKCGLYHTEMSLYRLLGESTIHQNTSGAVNSVSDVVLQRAKERKERENAIRNAIADLDLDRQNNTRFAVLYYVPGIVKSTGKALSPVPYLSQGGQFWYKLFQKL